MSDYIREIMIDNTTLDEAITELEMLRKRYGGGCILSIECPYNEYEVQLQEAEEK